MTKSNKNTRKKIIIATLLLMVISVAGFIAYDRISYSIEKQKFLQLRQDMVFLQKQFNSVDQGWEYDEWCRASGEIYKANQAVYCAVSLSNKTVEDLDKYNSFGSFQISQGRERGDKGNLYILNDVFYKESFSCSMNTLKNEDKYINASIGCTSPAHNFHFELDRQSR